MFIIVILLFCIIIFAMVMFSKSQKKNTQSNSANNKNVASIGMYFMELRTELRKKNVEIENGFLLQEYYYILGCASQGRLDEMKERILDSDAVLGTFFATYNKQLMKMAKIAKEVDEIPIGYDLKNGESIGEYFDRKISKRPAFMKEFEFFKNFDIQQYLKK